MHVPEQYIRFLRELAKPDEVIKAGEHIAVPDGLLKATVKTVQAELVRAGILTRVGRDQILVPKDFFDASVEEVLVRYRDFRKGERERAQKQAHEEAASVETEKEPGEATVEVNPLEVLIQLEPKEVVELLEAYITRREAQQEEEQKIPASRTRSSKLHLSRGAVKLTACAQTWSASAGSLPMSRQKTCFCKVSSRDAVSCPPQRWSSAR